MFKDLIEYVELLEAEPSLFGFCDVTFKRDFGPWKKGDNVESLWFETEKSTVEERSEDGEVIHSCEFRLEAI